MTPSIKNISDFDGFQILESDWDRLWKEVGDDNTSVFASFAWHETWWRHYSDGALLNLLTLWEGDRLVGIAPLMITKTRIHGLTVRAVGFIENRNSLHNDFLVLPMYRELFLGEVLRVLFEQSAAWDVIILNNLPTSSRNCVALLGTLTETGKFWQQSPALNSPYLNPSNDWSEYLASRSTRTRKSLRNIQNSLYRTGEVAVRNIRTWDEYMQVREDLCHVAKLSWTEEIGDSLATPVNVEFFDDLARRVAREGWLSVWALYLNGRMIAFEFHLTACSKEHAMRASYLPEFSSLSPGTFLEMQILKHAFEEADRVAKYDFGGSFDIYKRKWTDDAVSHCELKIFNDNLFSRLVAFQEKKSVPLLKYIRDAIRTLKRA